MMTNLATAPTHWLLMRAAVLTRDTRTWTPEQRSGWVDQDLDEILVELENRGYQGAWEEWVKTGDWDNV